MIVWMNKHSIVLMTVIGLLGATTQGASLSGVAPPETPAERAVAIPSTAGDVFLGYGPEAGAIESLYIIGLKPLTTYLVILDDGQSVRTESLPSGDLLVRFTVPTDDYLPAELVLGGAFHLD